VAIIIVSAGRRATKIFAHSWLKNNASTAGARQNTKVVKGLEKVYEKLMVYKKEKTANLLLRLGIKR